MSSIETSHCGDINIKISDLFHVMEENGKLCLEGLRANFHRPLREGFQVKLPQASRGRGSGEASTGLQGKSLCAGLAAGFFVFSCVG